MLFLLKRTVMGGIAGLLVLTALGLGLRHLLGDSAPPLSFTVRTVCLGAAVCGVVLLSDALIHFILWRVCGEPYRRRYRELADVFRSQSVFAIATGGLMAGIGEELVFRGLLLTPWYLIPAAVVFGGLHQLPAPLSRFTIWFIWEG